VAHRMNLSRLKKDSKASLNQLEDQLGYLTSGWSKDYDLRIEEDISKWAFRMSVVDVHSVWERFCEDRLAIALNHDPKYFLERHEVSGVSRISKGLAYYIVRGGLRYFDFRSMNDLIGKADHCVGQDFNPFRKIAPERRKYLDILATIRNFVVHGSVASEVAYKAIVVKNYGLSPAPKVQEFLGKMDRRQESPAQNWPHLVGFIRVVDSAIDAT
jgi:hypothetical protein